MIIIGSAILLAIGLLGLLWQAIAIAFSLIKIAYYLAKGAVCLVVLIICVVGLGVQYVMRWRWPKPEPVITINFYSADDDDGPTIDLPREHFHRQRG
jgi:hypothetical protein